MKRLILITGVLLIFFSLHAQVKITPDLQRMLEGKTDFYSIKNTVEGYYTEQQNNIQPGDSVKLKSIKRQMKFWNRWFYDNESRLNAEGRLENYTQKLLVADAELNRLANAAENNLANSDWTLIGPTQMGVEDGIGRVLRMGFDPVNSQIVYAGTARGGLWRSVNGGSNWSPLSSFLPSLGVSGIEVDANNSSNIYILSGEGDAWFSGGFTFSHGYVSFSEGVFKSTDGGNTWNKTGDFPLPQPATQYVGFQLRQALGNSNTLLAATSQGIFRTTNGGNTWAASQFYDLDSTFTNATLVGCFDIEFKPDNSSVVYAGCYKVNGSGNIFSYAMFRSTDGGLKFYEHWPVSNSALIRFDIGVSPAAPNNVYLASGPGYVQDGNGSNNTFFGFFRSTNSGLTFLSLANSPDIWGYNPAVGPSLGNQCLYDMALAVSPTNVNNIFTGGLVVFRSTNGGSSFSNNTTYWTWEVGETIHPDIHDLKFNPLNGRLYAATDGGVYYTDDNGTSWTAVFNGLSISQFYHSEPDNENNQLWGGTQDNGIMERVSGSVFHEFDAGDGYDVMTDNIVGNGNDSYWTTNGAMMTTRTTGNSDITPPNCCGFNRNFGNMDMKPTNEDHIYVGYSDAIWYSKDQGASWETDGINNRLDDGTPKGEWCIQTCPSSSTRLYTAGGGRLWRVDNINFDNQSTGNTTSITGSLINAGFPANTALTAIRKVTDILVHPSSSSQLWVTAGGFLDGAKVFYSSDAGSSWANISYNLPNVPANCLVRDGDGTLYIGMDMGVFYLPPGGANWIPFYNDLPRVPVTEMHIVFEIVGSIPTKFIYASTFGRGIWKTEAFTGCTTSLTLSQNLVGQQFFQAGTTISSTSLVTGYAGTNVYFQAGNNVTLTPGFEAKAGTLLHSYILGCNEGPFPAFTEYESRLLGFQKENDYLPAFIETVSLQGKKTVIKYAIFKEGVFDIKIIKENGEVVAQPAVNFFAEKGTRQIETDISGLETGLYYVVCYKNNRALNKQEMRIVKIISEQ